MDKSITHYLSSLLKNILAVGILFGTFVNASAQTTCPACPSNLSFENGTFANWTGTYGNYTFTIPTPVNNPDTHYVLPNAGTPSPRFAITSGTGTDPNTLNKVPVVAPCGGTYSARVGFTGSPESQAPATGLIPKRSRTAF